MSPREADELADNAFLSLPPSNCLSLLPCPETKPLQKLGKGGDGDEGSQTEYPTSLYVPIEGHNSKAIVEFDLSFGLLHVLGGLPKRSRLVPEGQCFPLGHKPDTSFLKQVYPPGHDLHSPRRSRYSELLGHRFTAGQNAG